MFASNNNFSNNYYEFENNDSSYNGIIITTGLFSWTIWKLYSDNVFRRQAIEGYFKTVDIIYNKFYEVWYDDKIRRQMLDKINVTDKHYHNNFDEESILITNEDGFAIDNDKFNEVEKIFEEFYNYNDDFIDEDE